MRISWVDLRVRVDGQRQINNSANMHRVSRSEVKLSEATASANPLASILLLAPCPCPPAARRLVISLCLGQPWLHRDLRCWRAGGDGRFQGGVDRDQAIESAEAEHAPDDRRGDPQPQLRAAGGGALVGTGPQHLRQRDRTKLPRSCPRSAWRRPCC